MIEKLTEIKNKGKNVNSISELELAETSLKPK
jgi:hypothetical protein